MRGSSRRVAGGTSSEFNLQVGFWERTTRNLNSKRSSLGIGNREVALFAADEQARQATRWGDLHLDPVPLAVVNKVRGPVADRVLVTEFEGDLLEDVVHLGCGTRVKSLAA